MSVTHTTEISVPLTSEISVKSSAKADDSSCKQEKKGSGKTWFEGAWLKLST